MSVDPVNDPAEPIIELLADKEPESTGARRRAFYACVSGLITILIIEVLIYSFSTGGRNKIGANETLSPWDTSPAPPQHIASGSVKVKPLPKIKIIPAKTTGSDFQPSGYGYGDSQGYGASDRSRRGYHYKYGNRRNYRNNNGYRSVRRYSRRHSHRYSRSATPPADVTATDPAPISSGLE